MPYCHGCGQHFEGTPTCNCDRITRCGFCNEEGHERDDCPTRREMALPKLCAHPQFDAVEVCVIGPETGRNVTYRICDACRRVLCTCGRCSASWLGPDDGELYCNATPAQMNGANDETGVTHNLWCRDGWRQARPWTLEEARRWLGLVGESMAVAAAKEAAKNPDWMEPGP